MSPSQSVLVGKLFRKVANDLVNSLEANRAKAVAKNRELLEC
jgi:hypothetical protein